MADYYTEFSFAIPDLTDDETTWLKAAAIWLDAAINTEDDEHVPPMPELEGVLEDRECGTSFAMEVDDDGLWIHSDESGDVDEVARFCQAFLRKFRPDEHVAFEWANTCSKPRLDAFGGGAMIVTAEAIESMSTGEWVGKMPAAGTTPVHVWVTRSAGAVAMEWDVDRVDAFRRIYPAIHEDDDVSHALVRVPTPIFAVGGETVADYLRQIGAF